MAEAGRGYVRLADLHERAGALIAGYTGAEAACVTTGAAAGIALMVAACVAGADPAAVELLPEVAHDRREVLVQIGHMVSFGAPVAQMIRLGRRARRSRSAGPTASAATTSSRRSGRARPPSCTSSRTTPSTTACSRSRPASRSAAPGASPSWSTPRPRRTSRQYVAMGVDAVAYSGGKAFGGPTSGFVAGRRDLIAACRAQERGIGRPMKVGKEAIVGLLIALERYARRDEAAARAELARQQRIVALIADGLRDRPDLRVETLHDEAGREIVRAAVHVGPARAAALARHLAEGDAADLPARPPRRRGLRDVDPRPIDDRDARMIVERIREWTELESECAATVPG